MDYRIYGKSLHQPLKLFVGKVLKVCRSSRLGESTTFYTLVEQQEAIALPQKPFIFEAERPQKK